MIDALFVELQIVSCVTVKDSSSMQYQRKRLVFDNSIDGFQMSHLQATIYKMITILRGKMNTLA